MYTFFFLLDDFQILEDLGEFIYSSVYLFFGVCSHQSKTEQSVLWSTCRWNNRIDEHAFVECHLGRQECLFSIANVKRNDWAFGLTDFEARLPKPTLFPKTKISVNL